MKNVLLLICLFAALLHGAPELRNQDGSKAELDRDIVRKSNAAGVSVISYPSVEVESGKEYEAVFKYRLNSAVHGALVAFQAVLLDGNNAELGCFNESLQRLQLKFLTGVEQTASVVINAGSRGKYVRLQAVIAGNPVELQLAEPEIKPYLKPELYKGIYSPPDQEAPREETLQKLRELTPLEAWVERRGGRPVLMVNGEVTPYAAYRGEADFSKFAAAGINMVNTFNRGSILYRGVPWDKETHLGGGKFDFSRLEANLLRIYAENPNARVVVTVDCNADNDWLAKNPDSIFRDEAGRRGIARHTGFQGFGDQVDKQQQTYWAQSYSSEEYQQYILAGLRSLADFLKNSPAGNIVIGFTLAGGHDGQFVQWQYSDVQGHMDYSPSHRRALRKWLRERYATDASLQKAWGSPTVTLDTAANPTVEQYRSKRLFNGQDGLNRQVADCREFISVSTARMLNRFGETLKTAFGRRCVIQSWYSSGIWCQTGRLSIDELLKDGNVNIISMVSNYAPPRLTGYPGASANFCIAALNLRNALYVQELDHRTWRSQKLGFWNYTAEPGSPEEFRNQVLRDAGSVFACGGYGFYYYDMFGSWYNDPEALNVIEETGVMARKTTSGELKAPNTQVAFFLDEKSRFFSETASGSLSHKTWQVSGLTPDIYYLQDIADPNLPDYRLYVVYSPLTITAAQLEALREKAQRPGKVLLIVGEAGFSSRDFSGSVEVMARLGMKVREYLSPLYDLTETGGDDPLLQNVSGRLGGRGPEIRGTRLICPEMAVWNSIDDPDAKILGRWQQKKLPALGVKRHPQKGTLIFSAQNGGISPELLYNAAVEAGITPPARPGNAVYAGHGVIAVHRLTDEIEVRFDRPMKFFELSGQPLETGKSLAVPCRPGESAIRFYSE
jgi:beta-galactosidase